MPASCRSKCGLMRDCRRIHSAAAPMKPRIVANKALSGSDSHNWTLHSYLLFSMIEIHSVI